MKNKFKVDIFCQSIKFKDEYEDGLEKYYPRIILETTLPEKDNSKTIPNYIIYSINTVDLSFNSIYNDKCYMELKFNLSENDTTDFVLPSILSLDKTYLKIKLNLFDKFDINFDKCYANTRFDKNILTIGVDISISKRIFYTKYQITTPEIEGIKFSEIRETIFDYLKNKESDYIGSIEIEDVKL